MEKKKNKSKSISRSVSYPGTARPVPRTALLAAAAGLIVLLFAKYMILSADARLMAAAEGEEASPASGTVQEESVQDEGISIESAEVEDLRDMYWTGKEIRLKPVVILDGTVLEKDTDYVLSYSNNVEIGTATVKIRGIGGYTGVLVKTYRIKPIPVEKAVVTDLNDAVYNGSEIKRYPTVTVDGVTLKKDRDYTLSYRNNVNVGRAVVVIKGKGHYTGTLEKKFQIKQISITKASVSGISSKTYTGSPIRQSIHVTIGDKTLAENRDYTVSYANNTNAGKAVLNVVGKGVYTGKITRHFTILRRSLHGASLGGIRKKVWNGSAHTQSVVVRLNGKTLKKGRDYSLTYKNCRNVGTATVMATGKGNYKDTKVKHFLILPKGTSITKLKGGDKVMAVFWRKQDKQTTGYQIQYSSRSSFSTSKVIKLRNNQKVYYRITGLAADRRYYVRVRPYRKVGDKQYFANWSSVWTVKTLPRVKSELYVR